LAVLVIAAATLAGAWYFQLVLGLQPCPMCLEERYAYYLAIPLAALLALAAGLHAPRGLLICGLVILALAALGNAVFGAYHAGGLSADNRLAYYAQARYQVALITRDQYRPGNELDGAIGITYDFGKVGRLTKVAPVLSLLGSLRAADSGANADPLNSGYGRLMIAPGVDFRLDKWKFYADLEVPVFQNLNAASSVSIEGTSGQLVTPIAFKLEVGYDF